MSRIKILKKTNRKPKSRRILKKLLQTRLDEILDEIYLESTSQKNIIRPRLIKRQLINFLEKDYFKISILDTCSSKNLIDFCNDYHIKKDLDKAQTHLIYHPVINQDVGHIIDKAVFGWFSPDDSEIVITGDLNETKSTLIHEFSHFLYDYKFGDSEFDFLDSVNDEFESYFQELIVDADDDLLDNNFLRVENSKEIRQMFEKRFKNTIYCLFVSYLEDKINDYCHQINLLKKKICLYSYLDYCSKTENRILSINPCNQLYNYYFYYVKYYALAESRKKLDNYFKYCEILIEKFSNPILKNDMLKCLELTSKLKTKIYYQDINFLNRFVK